MTLTELNRLRGIRTSRMQAARIARKHGELTCARENKRVARLAHRLVMFWVKEGYGDKHR